MSKRDFILKEIFDYSFLRTNTTPFDKFWCKSLNHFQFVMLLGSSEEESLGYTYEDICGLYPHKHASRTTIHAILNEGVEKGFFVKKQNPRDRRKLHYKLTSEQKKQVMSWLDKHPIRNIE